MCLHDVKKQIIANKNSLISQTLECGHHFLTKVIFLSLEVLKIGISLQEIKYIWP